MDLMLFDEVAEAFRSMVPAELGEIGVRARRYGIKVWFDAAEPPREHYEAQVIGAAHDPDATMLALEIGFHAEHRKAAENTAALDGLLAARPSWAALLGEEAVAGPFLGRARDWCRISETWPDPDLSDPEMGLEIAGRLIDYVTALEPLRRAR